MSNRKGQFQNDRNNNNDHNNGNSRPDSQYGNNNQNHSRAQTLAPSPRNTSAVVNSKPFKRGQYCKRPDIGTDGISIDLMTNFFKINIDSKREIYHYDVSIFKIYEKDNEEKSAEAKRDHKK